MILIWLVLIGMVISKFSIGRHTINMKGNSTLGYYYATFLIGSPPQPQSLILDTGSHITTFPCKSCDQNCGVHQYQSFDNQQSSTFQTFNCSSSLYNFKCQDCQNDQCKYSISYTEGSSLQGYYSIDKVVISEMLDQVLEQKRAFKDFNLQSSFFDQFIHSTQNNIMFGCTEMETRMFKNQYVNGILGLGSRSNSIQFQPNIVDFEYEQQQHGKESLSFSLCIGHDGGYITFGGSNTNKVRSTDKVQLEYNDDNDQYSITIQQVRINSSHTMQYSVNDVIVDSGTTLTYVNSELYDQIAKYIKLYYVDYDEMDPQLCFDQVDKVGLQRILTKLPILEFHLQNDQVFEWTPINYVYYERNKYCVGIQSYGSDRIILGANFMRNHQFNFDKQNKQITIQKADCQLDNDTDLVSDFISQLVMPNLQKSIKTKKLIFRDEQAQQRYSNDIKQIVLDLIQTKTNVYSQKKVDLIKKIEVLTNQQDKQTSDLNYIHIIYVLIILILLLIIIFYRNKTIDQQSSQQQIVQMTDIDVNYDNKENEQNSDQQNTQSLQLLDTN